MKKHLTHLKNHIILYVFFSTLFVVVANNTSFLSNTNYYSSIKEVLLDVVSIKKTKQKKAPINAISGPGLTAENFSSTAVGTILSENDTNGKAVSAVAMHNGYLFVPMGADHGGGKGDGAFAFYDVSNQRSIKKLFDSRDDIAKYHTPSSFHYVGNWAEVHSLPVIGNLMIIPETSGKDAGIAIFDTSKFYDNNPSTSPDIIGRFKFPGVTNPSNYDGLTFSHAVRGGRYVYCPTGTNGLFVVDIIDPRNPKLVTQIQKSALSNVHARSAFIMGDLLVLSEVENAVNKDKILLMNITDPANPVTLAVKNDFNLGYQGFMYGDEVFGISDEGIFSYNISNPSSITTKTYTKDPDNQLDRPEYGFGQDDFLFVGHYPGLTKWDRNNPQKVLVKCEPKSTPADDYAFLTPLGNTAVIASDHNTKSKFSFGVHKSGTDTTPPSAKYVLPKDNSVNVSVNASVGVSFSDFIDVLTLDEKTVQVRKAGTTTGVLGTFSQCFGFVSFLPNTPLEKNTTYEVVLKAGGVKDWSKNAIPADTIISTFSTGDKILTIKPPIISNTTSISVGQTATFTIDLQGETNTNFTYAWDFGDGSALTAYTTNLKTTHPYTTAGNFNVTLYSKLKTTSDVIQTTKNQIVVNSLVANLPSKSSTILYDNNHNLVWNVNPDNNSVSAVKSTDLTKQYEINVGKNPSSISQVSASRIWVTNSKSNTISVINSDNGTLVNNITLPYGSTPVSIVTNTKTNTAYVSLQSTNEIAQLNTVDGALISRLKVGPAPGNLALDNQRKKLWVARFISPDDAGKMSMINTDTFTVEKTISLLPNIEGVDGATNGRGLPNYLGAIAISPDGTQLFVPAKKDNIYRGLKRDGQPLTFENTVRSIGIQVDLSTNVENFSKRADFNNNDFATSAIYSTDGSKIFVTTNGTSTIWIVDAFNTDIRSELNSGGDSPDGLTISPDGSKLFVHNFISRSIVAFDLSSSCNGSCGSITEIKRAKVVTNELLSEQVLLGKKMFYNSNDSKLSQDGYMSCASCHLGGGHDGRTWDFTNLGEGMRNTVDLRGKGRKGHGRPHWTANFDEIQDFENQIREFSQGIGLMNTADFEASKNPLGNKKKGKSKELDALAAYLESLNESGNSPYTNNGSLTTEAVRGKTVYNNLQCITCHGGGDFTDSPSNKLHDIGTIKPSSGSRIGGNLSGLDTPTLRGLWYTSPYLHDGSAATLTQAVNAHTKGVNKPVNKANMDDLVAYLLQISDNECLYTKGTPCDDNDPATTGDAYNENCECIGVKPNTCSADGKLVVQRYENIGGSMLDLTNNPVFPYSPTSTSQLTTIFESAPATGDNYGNRVEAIICAPQTGNYTFWVAGDDLVELYLSTNEFAYNDKLIATTTNWTEIRQWDKYPTQQSATIALVANQKYHITLLQKETNGGDSFSVGWRLPNGVTERPMSTKYFESIQPIIISSKCEIIPYANVNNKGWEISTNLSVAAGQNIIFGPQTKEFGTAETGWSWTGPNNFTSTGRRLDLNNVQFNQVGVYQATNINSNGCQATIQYTVGLSNTGNCVINPFVKLNNEPLSNVSTADAKIGDQVLFSPQLIAGSNANTVWDWTGPNSLSFKGRELLLTNLQENQTGTYTVILTDANGCRSSHLYVLTVNNNTGVLSNFTENVIDSFEVSIYPNPVGDYIFIESSKSLNGAVYIISDATGKILTSNQIFSEKLSDNKLQISTSTWASGLYFINLENQSKKMIKRMIKL